MTDSLISVNNGECESCELVLTDTDKYCPECGCISELGTATEALRRMGDVPDDEFTIGMDSMTSVPAIFPSSGAPDPYVGWKTYSDHNTSGDSSFNDPLNQLTYTFRTSENTSKTVKIVGDEFKLK